MIETDGGFAPEAVFSAAGRTAYIIINFFYLADLAMMNNDLKKYWVYLERAYVNADFSLKETERVELEQLWKKINPYNKSSFGLLKEYHLKLRRFCKKFFIMGGQGDPCTAIYR